MSTTQERLKKAHECKQSFLRMKKIQDIQCAALRVYDYLGYGLSELAYEKALSEELRDYGFHTQTEHHLNEYYITSSGRKIEISCLRVDILVDNEIILELKTMERKIIEKKNINNTKEFNQCKRYKKIMNSSCCYLINFGKIDLEFIEIE